MRYGAGMLRDMHTYGMPRDFQDRLGYGGYMSCSHALRLMICAFKGKCHTSNSMCFSLRAVLFCGIHTAKMDGRCNPCTSLLLRETLSNFGSIYSTVQQVCIPQAILGTDVLCQAKSGLGKTAVFVLTTLQQVEPVAGETSVLIMCHTRELAYQIKNEYARFSKYMPDVKTAVFYGGTPIQKDAEILKNKDTHPHIIVATPGRLNALVRDKHLRLNSCKVFVLDECDKMLDQVGMIHFRTCVSKSPMLM